MQMQINEDALKRIKTSKIGPGVVSRTLETLAESANLLGVDSTEFKVDYQSADTPVKPGDLIPYFVFGLRPATMKETE